MRPIRVPSGVIYEREDLDLLARMHRNRFVVYMDEPVTLSSGMRSHFYINGRQDLTDDPELEWMIGDKISRTIYENFDTARQPCLIGVPVCGNTLAQAASMVSHSTRESINSIVPLICHRVMREQKKGHGAHTTWIYGEPNLDRHEYWFVDNVITTGGSFIKAAEKAVEDGYPARMSCLIWIDRQQGGIPRMRAEGFGKVLAIYNFLDIVFAFGEMNLWPKKAVAFAEEENRNSQFKP